MMNRALTLAAFSALFLTSQITKAQSFTISPEHELVLKAASGELTTESLTFTNNSDKEISIATSYVSDPTIGVDMPKAIVIAPKQSVDYIISFLGNEGTAGGEITLKEGDLVRTIDLRGNISETSETEQEASATVYDAGNKEIAFSVGPNPAVANVNITVGNASSASIMISDVSGKLVASSKGTSFTWSASSARVAGTYFVTVRGITTSGKPFDQTRKIAVN